MHALEKILTKASGEKEVKSGDIVTVNVDIAGINDLYLQVLQSFEKIGIPKVWDPAKVVFFFDHYAPAPTIKSAANQKVMRDFATSQGIENVFDINTGVCHQVLVEAGLSLPGKIVVITDSHSTTHGALGALGTGVGATDLAAILASGKTWMMVPEVMAVKIEGKIPEGVMAKDIILSLIGKIGPSGGTYKAIEYMGETVENMSLAERMVLCNMAVELGAKTSYIQPNKDVIEYLTSFNKELEIFETDNDFVYAEEHSINVEKLKPQVALPHSIDNVFPVEESPQTRIHQAFVGTCTGGRLEDIKVAASILKGKKIASHTRLVVIPASSKILIEAMNKGYVQSLMEAGATFSTPGCGPCLGAHQGVIAPGEACITTSSRNFPGRMGSTEGEVLVASPATVAASALTGHLCDPREHMK